MVENYASVNMASSSIRLACFFLLLSLGLPVPYLSFTILCASQVVKMRGCSATERQALLDFKEGLALDPSSNGLSSWHGEDCCSWEGISCNNITGHVEMLDVRSPNMSSNQQLGGGALISPSLVELKHLKYLDLSSNCFNGSHVPAFIGSLKELQYLDLSFACFSGLIPAHLGNLSNLQHLALRSHDNLPQHQFLPTSSSNLEVDSLQWVSGLTSLKHLDLGFVNLSTTPAIDWPHHLETLSSLSKLLLPGCDLNSFHAFPSTNMSSLQVLDLSFNHLQGSIPEALANLTNLQILNLESNDIEGDLNSFHAFPSTNMSSLQVLDLSFNHLQGSIPEALANLTNLQILNLESNDIEGDLNSFHAFPSTNMSSLQVLDLSFNHLQGSIPEALANLTNLQILNLEFNDIEGEIPGSLGGLCNLKELYLHSNKLRGEITGLLDGFAMCSNNSLKSLEVLTLGGNMLKGRIPESLGQLSELNRLELSENSWEGNISEAHFTNLKKLQHLFIASSSPSKHLVFNVSSDWIPPFSDLHCVDLSSCQLGPSFPLWLKSLRNLTSLILQNVGISDNIPHWFRNIYPNLYNLDLSDNKIRGTFPLWSASRMRYLSLSNNLFSGPIPFNLHELIPMLEALDLSGNSINGGLPSSVCKLKSLTILVLSNTHLSGDVPQACLKSLENLLWLNLANNKLSGKILDSMGSLKSLQFLKLSNNSFSGELHLSMQNCKKLLSIDLRENGFSGNIPEWLGSFSNLAILSLRSNSFDGHFPQQICSLSNLRVLDIGNNKLSGRIPHCFNNFTGMATVGKREHFSRNYVSGSAHEIAFVQNMMVNKGTQLEMTKNLDFLMSIDLSQNSLWGEIPEEITSLLGLVILNLSINNFSGSIPMTIGRLQMLESLDLSRNQLNGSIPVSISSLTKFNHLNLSYNDLSGPVPTSTQIQSLVGDNASIFDGNPKLCGPLVKKRCDDNEGFVHTGSDDDGGDDDEGNFEVQGIFISVVLGFMVGFWGVCGTLMLKKSWRRAFSRFLDGKIDEILQLLPTKKTRLSQEMELRRNHA